MSGEDERAGRRNRRSGRGIAFIRGFRADHGRTNPWEPGGEHRDFEPRSLTWQMRRRQRMQRMMERRRPWWQRQSFGCLFFLVFIVIVGSFVTVTSILLGRLGPVPVVIAAIAIVVVVAGLLRGLAGAVRDLDDVLEATRQVRGGDYTVRLRPTRSDLPPIQELARGFDTMVRRLEVDEAQRRTLLADVTHELRTPLAVITANLEGVLDGIYPPDEEHIAPILDETRTMERLIEDLRTLALSDAGTLRLHPETLDPNLLVRDVVRSFAPEADRAGIELKASEAAAVPAIEADPVRIREVLSNLVSNALRHTPRGGRVDVSAALHTGRVRIEVRDSGAGIDAELLPHVFDRFVRGDASHGSGLGLAIAKSLTEAHGGSISVDSWPGSGSVFRVDLPPAGDAPDLPPRRTDAETQGT